MSKATLRVVGVIVLVIAASGAFFGGMLFERSRASDIRAAFFAERGLDGRGQFTPRAGGLFGGLGAGRVVGQIKSIDGDTLQISTPQNVTAVEMSDATRILKLEAGAREDLKVGEYVSVRGESDSSGAVSASDIQILGSAPNALFP